jgi:hypothetical protein
VRTVGWEFWKRKNGARGVVIFRERYRIFVGRYGRGGPQGWFAWTLGYPSAREKWSGPHDTPAEAFRAIL